MLGSMLCDVFDDLKPICWDRDDIDITSLDVVRSRLLEARPDLVINAAAYTDVDGAEENKEAAFLVNEAGIRNIATVAMEVDAKVVHYSTDYVFPGDKEEGYTEDDSPGPAVNVYGESKLAGERALKETGVSFYLLRTAWLYGPNGDNFVETMIKLGKDRDSLSVVSDQRGCPTFTKDLALATREIVTGEYSHGIYHVVNDGQATWFEFAQKIFEYAEDVAVDVKPTTSSEFPRPAKRPAFSILQNTRGPKMRSWQEALDEYIRTR